MKKLLIVLMLAIVFLASTSIVSADLWDNLQNYYGLNDNGVDVISANNVTGWSGGYKVGKIDNGAYFNSYADDGSTINNIGITGASPRTISFWVNTTTCDTGGSYAYLFGMGSGCAGSQFAIGCSSGGAIMLTGCGGGDTSTGAGVISVDDWYHIVVTFNGSTSKIYSNNVLEKTSVYVYNTANDPIIIGGWSGNPEGMTGHIDEVGIWSRELTEAEITELYNSGDGLAYSEEEPEIPYTSNITNCTQLQDVQNNLTGDYLLMNNIDCSDTINWNSGEGFIPIGNDTDRFFGTFDGQGYNITDLYINRIIIYQGLFGVIGDIGIIRNVKLIDMDIEGSLFTGGLAGMSYGNITNCSSTGIISAPAKLGGLVGAVYGLLTNSFSTAKVSLSQSQDSAGGLTGWLGASGNIINSYATGNVTGKEYIGGLVCLLIILILSISREPMRT